MKILHTADWHLGRQFHNVSLLEDQNHALNQVVSIAEEYEVEAVVIAGDVYDRSVPPAGAVELLDDVLHRLTAEVKTSVILIAGNHDSAIRLAHGSREMESSGVFIRGPLQKSLEPVVLEDRHGEVYFCVLPYADPSEVRIAFDDEGIRTHDSAVEAMVSQALSHVPEGARKVGIAHCWVEGGTDSESERPLTVGGTGQVMAAGFEAFDYVGLGHLHRPQKVTDRIQYSGSLLKYSFSEIDHSKSVSLVEVDANGDIDIERIELKPIRDVRLIEGHLSDVLEAAKTDEFSEDYLLVRLEDEGAILDAMGQLRSVYPNTLHIERPGLKMMEGELNGGQDHRKRSELDLFNDFYRQMRGSELNDSQRNVIEEVVDEIRSDEREVIA